MRGVVFLLYGIYLCLFFETCLADRKAKEKTRGASYTTTREEIPNKRTVAIKRKRGAILERWDGIDGYLSKNLLNDPRYPSMPTYFSYISTFSEPSNWGDNYGSRLRGYFVPQATGLHVFFIESDNEGQLFLSTTDDPAKKILICKVGKDHESLPMQFRKYPEQESYPINLKKDKYYYIEALHKEQYGNDSLAVAVQTPDKILYAPIPSQFLWTSAPPRADQTATQSLLIKIAAKAGAKAGAELGLREAKESGAKAGAMAGAEAGGRAGAEAGVEAATKAATEVADKALKEALAKLGTLNKSVFNIYTGNGSVIPVKPAASSVTGEQIVTAEGKVTGQTGATGVAGQTSGQTTSGQTSTGQAGASSSVDVSVTVQPGMPSPPVSSQPGIYQGAYVYNRAIPYYIPPKSYDPQTIARNSKFLDSRGFARVIVNGGIYALYAIDVPASQNPIYNLCWRITKGNLELTQSCQAFIVHIPGFDKGTGEHQTIAFESVCVPGHYVRQKNYKFALGQKGDKNFDYDASSAFFQVFSLPGAFQFSLMRKGWYICRSVHINFHRTAVVTDYNMATLEWLKKCSFALRPLGVDEKIRMNCFDVLQPTTVPPGLLLPNVSSVLTTTSPPTNVTTHTTRPPTTPTTPPDDICLSFTFSNDAGIPFMLYSSLKPEGYSVTGPEISLKYVVKNNQFKGLARVSDTRDHMSETRREILSETSNELSDGQQLLLDPPNLKWSNIVVKFWAIDPSGKREILLNGKKMIYAIPGIHCTHQISVTVTSQPKSSPSTTKRTTTATMTTRPTTKPTLPPAPRTVPITTPSLPAAPSLPSPPHFHIYIHAPSPPPPPTTPEIFPPELPFTKPPPPPKVTVTTLPPAPPPIPITAPPPPPPSPPQPPSPTHAPPPPITTTESFCGPPPCITTQPPFTQPSFTTLPPCQPSSGRPSLNKTPCKPVLLPTPAPSTVSPACPPGSTKPCAPVLAVLPPRPPEVSPVALPTLPPIITLSPTSASWPVQGCMPTHGGTSQGACCMFPFMYNGAPQHRCTRAERGYRWCATTSSYDTDNQWGFCSGCFLSFGGTSNGNCCHFPFTYRGKIYTTCTTQDENRPWCATTFNHDIDKQWGYCGGDAPGSVSQPKTAFSPCSSDCDAKCVDSCPDYCCVQTMTSEPSYQPNQVVVPQATQVDQLREVQQTAQSCPSICAKFCVPDCPVRCCSLPLAFSLTRGSPAASMYCPRVCFSTCVSSCPAGCCSSSQPSVNHNSVSYNIKLPCRAECHSNCLATCPTQCCNPGSGRRQVISFPQVKAVDGGDNEMTFAGNDESTLTMMVRSKIVCPAICIKSCLWRCPRECCDSKKKESSNKKGIRNLVAIDCKYGRSTTGGNAQGACCNFPFIYKGAVYWTCTTKDSIKHWCSTTKEFEVGNKWGFCA
ncbi:uncharacterized protein [Montipora capricornis]|uniref:uncharacterized protein n=1 Tax=Montipora capricornis TaxID=246305 RepID=UPI0035F15600